MPLKSRRCARVTTSRRLHHEARLFFACCVTPFIVLCGPVLAQQPTDMAKSATAIHASDIIAKLPLPKVGDSCTYRMKSFNRESTYTEKITEITSRGFVRTAFDSNGQITATSVVNAEGNLLETKRSDFYMTWNPYYPAFDWPLSPEKKPWTKSYDFPPTTGGKGSAVMNGKVADWGTLITVPAGTFRAVKIELQGRYQDRGTRDGDGSGTISETFWYSETVPHCVLRSEQRVTNWVGATTVNRTKELIGVKVEGP